MGKHRAIVYTHIHNMNKNRIEGTIFNIITIEKTDTEWLKGAQNDNNNIGRKDIENRSK